uniref:Uncharacterized protein n=1 Tax=Panagrolaimus sp. JU765 TaxID=591449 RepID=A0AC34PZH9_9BILA
MLTFAFMYEPLLPYRPYCTFTNQSTTTMVMYLFFLLLGLTVISFILFAILLQYNTRSLIKKNHKFDINSHYHMKNNDFSLKFMIISTFLYLLVDAGWLIAHFYVRIFLVGSSPVQLHAFLESTYVVYTQAACSGIVLLYFAWCWKKQRLIIDKSTTDDHFLNLKNLWK